MEVLKKCLVINLSKEVKDVCNIMSKKLKKYTGKTDIEAFYPQLIGCCTQHNLYKNFNPIFQ